MKSVSFSLFIMHVLHHVVLRVADCGMMQGGKILRACVQPYAKCELLTRKTFLNQFGSGNEKH
jgi:hypothetical protein